MPSCGSPVYQPTTVSYEARSSGGNGTGGGLGFLAPASSVDSPLRIFRKPKAQLALFLFALISLAVGIAMLASGLADWIEFVSQQKQQSSIEQSITDVKIETRKAADISRYSIPLGLLLGGIFMTCMGMIGMGLYLKVADWRHNCICPCPCPFFDKKHSLARQLQCQNVDVGCGQAIMALNPSTDPLVSHTQYAPVSELPSLRADEEERRNLMPDNKDCLSSAEESDRMLEPDPRIVLRPMGRVEDA